MDTDGRRPLFLLGLPILILGSVGTAQAHTIVELLVFRCVQSIGASPGFSVGAGIIADIYKLEERGWAMGIYFSVRRVMKVSFSAF